MFSEVICGNAIHIPLPDKSVQCVVTSPTCNCDADVVPQIVLDPFAGTGTVGEASATRRRSFVGVELSMDYIALAHKRLGCIPVMMF